MLKPWVKILIVFLLIVAGVIICFVSLDTYKSRIARQMFDTVAYTEEDYELMRAYYNSDTAFQKMLDKNIRAGDSASIQMKAFLRTSYQFRDTTQMKDWEIKAMIHAYRTSADVLRKFAAIENELKKLEESTAPKTAEDSAARQYLDSIRNLVKQGKLPKALKPPLEPERSESTRASFSSRVCKPRWRSAV